MSKWIKGEPISCGTIMQWRESVIECQCPECKRWCLKWSDVFDYEKCPHCGEDLRKGGAEKYLQRYNEIYGENSEITPDLVYGTEKEIKDGKYWRA